MMSSSSLPLSPTRSSGATDPTRRPPEELPMMTLSPLACDAENDIETSGETLSLLSVASPPQTAWLERGHDYRATTKGIKIAPSNDWEVVGPLKSPAACCQPRIVEVVTLRNANFGLRWAGPTPTAAVRNKRSQPFCIVGPHWWLMAGTYAVLLLAALAVTVLTVPQAGPGEAATGVLLSAACLMMYAKVACTNPGIVEHLDEPLREDYTYCGECESYRPPTALHCMDCRACIDGYDHHCPWTGKCIGKGNVKYFYAWLFFLVLAFVYEMIEFTTYMLPPDDQPHPYIFDEDDDDDGSFSLRGARPSMTPSPTF